MNKKNGIDGFVLIEILSALVVFSIAAITFLHISRNTIDFTARAEAQYQSYQLAKSLFEIESAKRFPRYRAEEGYEPIDRLEWEIVVLEIEAEASQTSEQPTLADVTVRVSSDKNKDTKPVILRSIVTYGQN